MAEELRFTQADVDRIVKGRLREEGWDAALTSMRVEFAKIHDRLDKLDVRADHANGLKGLMVTNERFDAFERRLASWQTSVVKVETLPDGEVIVYGPTGFREDLDQVRKMEKDFADRRAADIARERMGAQRERWYDRRLGRIGIAAGVVVALATIAQAWVAIWVAIQALPHR